ncbi:YoaK family protein [uncultured Faecalicoccus sp.]|uniref:YoaK family protein n=1 Tax=uncultured Faecalicoccus sp. TaxID=1971760 RepID=UPI00261B5123|nr:YoaK family protein [uncultured Faecalicoccus sp.]
MNENKKNYLACERKEVFLLLMFAAGMMGAYTFILRGGVFCNAQTANFVMMAVYIGSGMYSQGLYYLIPVCAYFMGTVVSELLPNPVKKIHLFRWDTYLVAFEILVLFGIGWIPLSVNHHIVQVMINFIASMQYNTFRQAESIPMATTFCTNHLRQTGIGIVRFLRKNDTKALSKGMSHLSMLISFVLGGIVEAFFCSLLLEKAIWMALIPLMINFILLAYSDLKEDRRDFSKVPSGH